MKRISVVLLIVSMLSVFSSKATAQNKIGRVTGKAVDDGGKPLDGATISLLKVKDNTLAKSAVSSKNGEFEMEKIADGKYLVAVTAVGFAKFNSQPFDINETSSLVTLGSLQLKAATKQLSNVQVTATRPLIENKIDKTVVNVDAAISNIGTSALDVLERSPGISVDRDGNISLKGKQGVIVLLDGKPSYLSGADLANLLRNMQAGQLDQIEIMSQPSARFDASGNSGVINIKTKRNNLKGFNGSISLGYTQGTYPKSSNAFNINSRKGKVNVFANYGYSLFKGYNQISLYRNFRDNTTKQLNAVFDQKSFIKFSGQPHSLKFGLDFFASKNTTVGFVLGGIYNLRQNTVYSNTDIYNGNSRFDSANVAKTVGRDPWTNYSANLNLRHVFDSTGKELTADLDLIRYDSKGQQNSDNFTYSPAGNILGDPFLLRGNLPSLINIYSAKFDYTHPLKNDARFEAGAKSSYVETDNNAQYVYYDKPSNQWKNDKRSNYFIYEENINAVYVNTRKQFKKWGVQLGLRMENTNSKGKQITNGQTFARHYSQLFPTAYFSYVLNKANTFGLSYGRRIERPNYQDMNPFQQFLDQYTYRQGNPFLTPQFSHNVEVSHNYKGQLNTSINYTRTTDIINDILEQNDTTRITFQTKKNIATRRNIGLSISYNKPLTKYWTMSAFANVFNNYFTGIINQKPITVDYSTFMINVSNQFRFNKGWSGDLSGFYRYKSLEAATIVALPMGMFSVGVGKQVMKNKGTLRLSVRDPFFLQKFRGYTRFDNIDVQIRNVNDNRQVSLNFTYRFGKNQNNIPQRKRNNATQEEQNRVGQGG